MKVMEVVGLEIILQLVCIEFVIRYVHDVSPYSTGVVRYTRNKCLDYVKVFGSNPNEGNALCFLPFSAPDSFSILYRIQSGRFECGLVDFCWVGGSQWME